MTRKDILEAADKCVNGDRDKQYGSPEDNFGLIARYWSLYLGVDVSAVDVGLMMSLFKIARAKSGGSGSADNFVDLAGYAACAGEIWDKYAVDANSNVWTDFLNKDKQTEEASRVRTEGGARVLPDCSKCTRVLGSSVCELCTGRNPNSNISYFVKMEDFVEAKTKWI